MAAHAAELTFLEHLAGRFNIPVPRHVTASASRSQIRGAMGLWSNKAVAKPEQVAKDHAAQNKSYPPEAFGRRRALEVRRVEGSVSNRDLLATLGRYLWERAKQTRGAGIRSTL